MNAVEFVKNQINELGFDAGWDKVKNILVRALNENFDSSWCVYSQQNDCFYKHCWHETDIWLSEIKTLVQSWELIQSYKGLAEAKEYRKRWFKLSAAFNYSKNANKYIIDQLDKLQKAIADVESVGGGV